jgi:Ca2+-binding RTX toxin-like protein
VVALGIQGGSGGNTFTVGDTSRFFASTSIDTGSGDDTVKVGASKGALRILGDGGTNTLVGLVGPLLADPAFTEYAGSNTLTGNGGSDTYALVANTPGSSDKIIDNSGHGILNFAGTTPGLTLHLGSTAQQAVNSNLQLTLSSAAGIQNVVGGNGNDTLTGNGLHNILRGGVGNDTLTAGSGGAVLVGGSGSNTLVGGAGRSILIAGSGPSTATGGPRGDILIAGTTSFDSDNVALGALLAEWQRTEAPPRRSTTPCRPAWTSAASPAARWWAGPSARR